MRAHELSDAQWCVLDLLMKARERGLDLLSRQELLGNNAIPDSAKIKLTWAALTMPEDLVAWRGQHEFCITPQGVSLYHLHFGPGAKASEIAGTVICLPDQSARLN
jgi:hypothetical protein